MSNYGLLTYCGIFLIFTLFPIYTKSLEDPTDFKRAPMWVNPCAPGDFSFGKPVVTVLERDMKERRAYVRVIAQSYLALNQIYELWAQWVDFNFHPESNLWFENSTWEVIYISNNYLPTYEMTSKFLNGPIKKVDFEERYDLFPNLFEWLQRVAVGMEQLIRDQFVYEDVFGEQFIRANSNLQKVLCEMDVTMYKMGMSRKPDINRGYMTDAERLIRERNTRLIRDYGIVREYINMLQYTYLLTIIYKDFLYDLIVKDQNKYVTKKSLNDSHVVHPHLES